jgi:flagellar assembly protein FliH
MSKMWERADFWPADRVASPVADEFTRGVAEGRRTVEAELAAEREVLLQLVAGLEALEAPSPGSLAALMMAAVERLVTDIAGNAPVDQALLEERAEALSVFIAGEREAVLAVNPDDVAVFGDRAVIGDPALSRGTVQLRVGEAVIEDGVTSALARLRAEIAAMGIAL